MEGYSGGNWDLPPNPLPKRKGEWREVLRGIARGGLGFYGVIHSPKAIETARETNRQKAMRSPFLVGKGPGDRSLFHGIIHSRKAIETARETNRQKALCPPFLVGKGPGDRSLFHGIIHSRKAIETARETNRQKAMRSPFHRRHRRSLQ